MEDIQEETGVLTIVQARMNSKRLPGKTLLPLGNATVLEQTIHRIRAARFGQHFLVATSDDPADQPIRDLCASRGFPYFAGSQHDVLDRILRAAQSRNAQIIARCFACNPLLDPKMLDACARYALDSGMDYITVARLPVGVTSEAIPFRALLRTAEMTDDPSDREGVTTFALNHLELFERAFLPPPLRLARQDVRLTLETEEDYQRLLSIYNAVAPSVGGLIRVEDAIAYLDAQAEVPPQEPAACLMKLAA